MKFIQPDQLLSTLEWRYAVKLFDTTKKIPENIWSSLEKSLVLTPSSYGLQPWKFLVIRDPILLDKLKVASWNQKQVTDCSHYVVFLHKTSLDESYVTRFLETQCKIRNTTMDSLAGYKKVILGDVVTGERGKMVAEWSARQVYIALGNFMTSAALLGIDTCPMEGLDPKKYDEILGLGNTGYKTLVACAAGYRSENDKYALAKKVRFSRDEMIQTLD